MASKNSVRLGHLTVGGGAPVLVQSMTNTDTRDVEATLGQIARLVERGCEAVRVAVPDKRAADALRAIRDRSPVPLIADIHFDWRFAVAAVESGFDGIRINPGNIGDFTRVERVVAACKANGASMRVGVNSGSVEKELLERHHGPTPQAMVESARNHVRHIESLGFDQMVVSVKSSSVLDTLACYRALAKEIPYPLHLGVTEAGSLVRGTVKSAVGLGILLSEGIGDTIRVSLTADPTEEMDVAWEILRSLGLRVHGPEIISCPTCGRTEIDLIGMEKIVSERLKTCSANIRVAVMGCVVNGPGEAREADIGVAGGRDKGIIFRKGQVVRSVKGQEALISAFMEELQSLLEMEGTK